MESETYSPHLLPSRALKSVTILYVRNYFGCKSVRLDPLRWEVDQKKHPKVYFQEDRETLLLKLRAFLKKGVLSESCQETKNASVETKARGAGGQTGELGTKQGS